MMRCWYKGNQIFGQHGHYSIVVKDATYDADAPIPWDCKTPGTQRLYFRTLALVCAFVDKYELRDGHPRKVPDRENFRNLRLAFN